MKTGRTYLQLLGLATIAILLFGVFRPAHAAPQEKSNATSREAGQRNMSESTLARPVMKSSTKRTSRTQRISRLRCTTGTVVSPVTVPDPRT